MSANLNNIYTHARKTVVDAGYGQEIEWQSTRSLDRVTEQDFLRELAFVILNSGMKAGVIDGIWPRFRDLFQDFWSPSFLTEHRDILEPQALELFGNRGKVAAVFNGAKILEKRGWDALKSDIRQNGVDCLQQFPFIGPVTCYHLAKNVGLDVAKPDRHLERMRQAAGFDSTQLFCEALAKESGDSVPVVDIVLWRWATLDPDYLKFFRFKWPWLDMKALKDAVAKGEASGIF